MKNEYGAPLDRNGYAPSILQSGKFCLKCNGEAVDLVRHEIFGGPLREKSKRLGLWCWLHPICHYDIHDHGGMWGKKMAQEWAMARYGWTEEKFIEEFGKSYL